MAFHACRERPRGYPLILHITLCLLPKARLPAVGICSRVALRVHAEPLPLRAVNLAVGSSQPLTHSRAIARFESVRRFLWRAAPRFESGSVDCVCVCAGRRQMACAPGCGVLGGSILLANPSCCALSQVRDGLRLRPLARRAGRPAPCFFKVGVAASRRPSGHGSALLLGEPFSSEV